MRGTQVGDSERKRRAATGAGHKPASTQSQACEGRPTPARGSDPGPPNPASSPRRSRVLNVRSAVAIAVLVPSLRG
jgi:hypothetical protein